MTQPKEGSMGERPLPLGTQTQWGRIAAVILTGGERYYGVIDAGGVVALMPADALAPTGLRPDATTADERDE